MFCRFGSVEDSRPVAAIVCMNVVWMRPSAATERSSPSTVWRSRMASRCASRCCRNGCSVRAYSSVSAAASVVQPDLIFFVLGMPSWSKRTSWSCLGEPRFTSRPIAAYASAASLVTMPSKYRSSSVR